MAALLRFLTACFLAGSGPVWAQGNDIFRSPILTIDQDRLFEQARPGADSVAALEAAAAELAAENRRIEAELAREEREIAEARGTMTPEEFTARADEFDQRVQTIRAEQDEKARAFNIQRDEARQVFFAEVGDVLSQIVVERGAVIVLDLREVFLSADQIDITDEAIARVNAAFATDESESEPAEQNGPEQTPEPQEPAESEDQ